jgi:hypothetical protein
MLVFWLREKLAELQGDFVSAGILFCFGFHLAEQGGYL